MFYHEIIISNLREEDVEQMNYSYNVYIEENYLPLHSTFDATQNHLPKAYSIFLVINDRNNIITAEKNYYSGWPDKLTFFSFL